MVNEYPVDKCVQYLGIQLVEICVFANDIDELIGCIGLLFQFFDLSFQLVVLFLYPLNTFIRVVLLAALDVNEERLAILTFESEASE